MFNPLLLEILCCPITKGPLQYDDEKHLLISLEGKVAYKIEMGVPILLIDEAIPLVDGEI